MAGLTAGSVFNVKLEIVVAGILLVGAFTPITSAATLVFSLGLGVASAVKNLVKKTFTSKVETVREENPTVDVETVYEEAEEETKRTFWLFTSTACFSAFPLYLTTLISGLSGLLLPLSIVAIVWKGYMKAIKNPTKAIGWMIISSLIGGAAFLTISSGSTTAVLVYFLTLITIPSFFFKDKVDSSKDKSKAKERVFSLDSFLYANNSQGVILTALLLIQTVLWGSGKDALGTVVNGDLSIMFNPYRIAFTVIVLLFLFAYKIFFLRRDIDSVRNEVLNNKKEKKGWSFLFSLISLFISFSTFNPAVIAALLVLGLVINFLAQDVAIIRNVAVPALLLVGMFSGI